MILLRIWIWIWIWSRATLSLRNRKLNLHDPAVGITWICARDSSQIFAAVRFSPGRRA